MLKKINIEGLLQEMTISEKIGQLVQLTPDFFESGGEITGPIQEWNMSSEKVFQIGSVLGTHTGEQVYSIQKQYLEKNRLKIPLIFMADVIHGYETIYPIPLALAATFDEQTIEKVAELSAVEATEAGIHVTFSPMADHVEDARWGRVLEGNGEDPTLSAELTRAYVRGYQGGDLIREKNRIAACVKHFIGYGAAQGGRDYNTVDFSDLEMHQKYLPAFQAAIEEGVKLVMTSFNTVRGIPATGNQELIQNVLRDKLGFDGVVISDWAAIMELITHRVAENKRDAAELAFSAGVDMDMMSDSYQLFLEELIQTKEQEEKLNQAVLRVLHLKNSLGLFEDPYRGLIENRGKEKRTNSAELRQATREVAQKTQVLLKNDGILPLKPTQKVALIGPKADSKDILGAWSWVGKKEKAVSLAKGLSEKDIDLTVYSIKDGKEITKNDIIQASKVAEGQDIIILAVGETSEESGEAASLADITLSRGQEELIQAISKINKNVVVVLFNGRPLALTAIEPYTKAILEACFPGSEGGRAIADVLMGEVNPQGKLPMSFPRSVGQLPITYAQLSTGRPMNESNKEQKYISRYMDEKNIPLYPFGYGLSYSKFEIMNTKLSQKELSRKETIRVTTTVKNNSAIDGKTVIQLYLQDVVTKIARPTRELKKWRLIELKSQEEKVIHFEISVDDLSYVHYDLSKKADEGLFNLYIGFDSYQASLIDTFHYKK